MNLLKTRLQDQEKMLKERLLTLSQEQESLSEELFEAVRLGTFSWQAEVQSAKISLQQNSAQMLHRVQLSLERFEKGAYGRCEKCQKQIASERLFVVPVATICSLCL